MYREREREREIFTFLSHLKNQAKYFLDTFISLCIILIRKKTTSIPHI